MGFLQHYYVKLSTHCVRPVTHGPAHAPELPGIAISAKAASEDFATLRAPQGGVAFSQHSKRWRPSQALAGVAAGSRTHRVARPRPQPGRSLPTATGLTTYETVCERRQLQWIATR